MKKVVFLLFCTLVLAAIASPSSAATTAEFQANCASGIPTNCVLDPLRTPSGGTPTGCTVPATVTQYFVDWGDGTMYFYAPPPHQTSHKYCSPIQTDICLTVFCSDGTSKTTCHCFSNIIGINGCVRPGAGWTP
jgi:hypothetical protein